MILYFSATGNSAHTASRIASSLGEEAHSIENHPSNIILHSGEVFGIVTPTYSWELPIIVREYLEKVKITSSDDNYFFIVATYGTTAGAAGYEAEKILKKKGNKVNALYSVQMPDTWTPIFDLSDKEKVKKRLIAADKEIENVAKNIKERKNGNMMRRAFPYAVRYISDIFYRRMRKTKHFSVTGTVYRARYASRTVPQRP